MRRSEVGWLMLAVAIGVVGGWLATAAQRPLLAVVTAWLFAMLAWSPKTNLAVTFSLLFLCPVTVNAGWPGVTLTYALVALLGVAAVGTLRRVLYHQHRGGNAWPLGVVLASALLATLANGTGLRAAEMATRTLVVFGVVAWHVTAESRALHGSLDRAISWLLWVSAAIALLAVYQRVTGVWPILDNYAIAPQYHSFPGQGRSAGVMGHPIIYGAFCVAMILVSVARRPQRWPLFLLANAVGLILTGSRSAWIATAICLVALWLMGRARTPRGVVGTMYATAIGLVMLFLIAPGAIKSVLDQVEGRWAGADAIASANARSARIDAALDRIGSSDGSFLFGHGPGAATRYFSESGVGDEFARTFDNSYLYLWHDYGLLAMAGLLILLAVGIFRRGSHLGRILLLAFAILVTVFDAWQWPAAVGVALLGMGLRERGLSDSNQAVSRGADVVGAGVSPAVHPEQSSVDSGHNGRQLM